MPKRVIFVIGATGSIGSSTVAGLSTIFGDKLEIRAGVCDLKKAEKLRSLQGVSIVEATIGDDRLAQTLSGVDILYIATPVAQNRVELTVSTAWLAKTAGVKYMAVVSALTTDIVDTKFGRQFTEIEGKISKIGVPCTFIRLPLFTDDYWRFKDSIANHKTIYCPVDPEKPFTTVAIEDAGFASATILANPSIYTNKTVTVVSGRQTFREVAKEFSKALWKDIKYVRVPYEAAKKSLLESGFEEWHANVVLEFYKLIDSSNPVMSNSDLEIFTTITKRQPTSLKKWLAKHAGGFE
jgi:uncharacterized protein YbjT (DUF2867 family)